MAIYPEKETILIGVPKTASTSIEQYISQYAEPLKGQYKGILLDTGHASVVEHKRAGLWFPTFFSFAFIRNPWDRLVSAFFFLNSGGCTSRDEALKEKYISRYKGDFEHFVCDFVPSPSRNEIVHLIPQYNFISNQGRIAVDFVGRFEKLSEDFDKVCSRIGIPLGSLPRTMSSYHAAYVEYYNDALKRIVADVYANDIDLFDYRFA